MGALKKLSGIMANPTAYRLWQMPFAEMKFQPILEHNDMTQVRRVLDVGCGPGTNSLFFEDNDYLGLDINPDYICLLYTSPSPRDATLSRMPSSA